ncbi:MAG: ribonuclease HII [Bacteroidota bacterium]
MKRKMNPLKKFDNSFLSLKTKIIAGVDEAGRGPLAGPVVAAAVIFDKKTFHKEINDSKKLSEKKREELYDWITENCISYAIGIVEHEEIDSINILQAALKAMKEAALLLSAKPNLILIDGNKSFRSEIKTKTVVKGDTKSFSIAAASIIAKVTRDKIMKEAAKKFPEYMWESNKGYATRTHIEAVKKFGVSPFHRKSFLRKIVPEPSPSVDGWRTKCLSS